ncbi:MAG: AAA family ATPase [Verrucomicrobiota bacterium]
MKTWFELQNAPHAQIIDWAAAQPWGRAMAACQQDAEWHAEGDVWTHTRMVCAELEKLAEWPALNPRAQLHLLLTALFHDSGKPATTTRDPATGRIRSPHHAFVGAAVARRVLRDLGCDFTTREQIAALVRYHGRPVYLLEKPSPERELIALSWLVDNRLLHLFAVADTRGRDTREMNRPEENLHLWKLVAEECQCYDHPYAFVSEHARFLFYRERLSSLHYVPHEDFRCTVTLMVGLPGSGKDTWLARHRPTLPVISLDAVRSELDIDATDNQGEVIQAAREKCREHLRAHRDFAFNATNITQQTRDRWVSLFDDYHARVEIVYLEPPLYVVLAQNRARTSPVPENVIHRLAEKLDPPTVTEAHRLIVAERFE